MKPAPPVWVNAILTLLHHVLHDMREMSKAKTGPGLGSYVPAIALALISATALGAAQMRPSDAAGDQVAVVFAPGTGLTEAVAQIAGADGAVLRAGAFSNIVVAVGSTPGFVERVKERGAWLVVDPRGLGGCFIGPDATGTGRS